MPWLRWTGSSFHATSISEAYRSIGSHRPLGREGLDGHDGHGEPGSLNSAVPMRSIPALLDLICPISS